MPTPIATMEEGKTSWGAGPPTIDEDERGVVGKRWYKITGRGEHEDAMQATGLPKIGDPWSPGTPGLVVTNRSFKDIGGCLVTATQVGGWTACEVTYRTPDLSGSTPLPVYGKKYSEFEGGLTSLKRLFDFRVNPPPGSHWVFPAEDDDNLVPRAQIEGASGMQVGRGTVRLTVNKWVKGEDVNIKRMLALAKDELLNFDQITAPPMINDTRQWVFEPGELRYITFKLIPDGRLIKVCHIMEAAPDHYHRWQPIDDQGRPVGNMVSSVVYGAANYQGLW